MRTLCLTAVLLLAGPAPAADPPKSNPKAAAAAALALASSCDCPSTGRPRCGDVSEVLAKVSRDMEEEAARPAVAPMPREKPSKASKACGCAGGKCDDCPACECPKKPASRPPVPAAQVWDVRDVDGKVYRGLTAAEAVARFPGVTFPAAPGVAAPPPFTPGCGPGGCPTTPGTTVRPVGTPLPARGPRSGTGQPAGLTYMVAPFVGSGGSIDGCATGNCPRR